MRKLWIIFVLAAVPAWVVVYRFSLEEERSGFGYGFTRPAYVRVAAAFALISTLTGLSVLVFDFVRWLRREKV
jgi:hypothetical protein